MKDLDGGISRSLEGGCRKRARREGEGRWPIYSIGEDAR